MNRIQQFIRDDDGVTAIEYGLIAGLIAVVIISTVTDVGQNLKALFEKIAGQLSQAQAG